MSSIGTKFEQKNIQIKNTFKKTMNLLHHNIEFAKEKYCFANVTGILFKDSKKKKNKKATKETQFTYTILIKNLKIF